MFPLENDTGLMGKWPIASKNLVPPSPRPATPNLIGSTSLSRAAAKGHVAIVNLLLERGAGVNIPGRGGLTPLHEAAGCGQVRGPSQVSRGGGGVLVVPDGHGFYTVDPRFLIRYFSRVWHTLEENAHTLDETVFSTRCRRCSGRILVVHSQFPSSLSHPRPILCIGWAGVGWQPRCETCR